MPHWIYVLKPTRLEMLTEGSTPEEDVIVSHHFAYLSDLTEKGVMILMGRTRNNDESTSGIAIFEAENEEAARTIMENDLAGVGGVMRASVARPQHPTSPFFLKRYKLEDFSNDPGVYRAVKSHPPPARDA